ncbi:hypothetical protein SAMN05880590_10959 [Rhizobium sp. RU35A]|nr:hypothetical protein SAMN05880590_10959 [Rhizobium sp. RU35A]
MDGALPEKDPSPIPPHKGEGLTWPQRPRPHHRLRADWGKAVPHGVSPLVVGSEGRVETRGSTPSGSQRGGP